MYCVSSLRHNNLLSAPFKFLHEQCRHATLIRRPKRPYTFTQLVTLSDGSTFTHRTTSPAPVWKVTKDTRNSPLWNPSNQKLTNIEADEAGKLRAFREKFGRGWDAESMNDMEEDGEGKDESLMDLITGYGVQAESQSTGNSVVEKKERGEKGKGGER